EVFSRRQDQKDQLRVRAGGGIEIHALAGDAHGADRRGQDLRPPKRDGVAVAAACWNELPALPDDVKDRVGLQACTWWRGVAKLAYCGLAVLCLQGGDEGL